MPTGIGNSYNWIECLRRSITTGIYHKMVRRFDISDRLIHFTRGDECVDALGKLSAIIREGRLVAGNSPKNRGGYRCISFTEAPIAAFAGTSVSRFPFSRCSQFGLMFEKNWVYERGGRPVIYQPDSDYHLLPEELRWRHVRFEPTREQPIDWTREREWRIPSDSLAFTPAEAAIVVPNERWANELRRVHDAHQDRIVEMYAEAIDQEIAEMWRRTFRWPVVPLG